MWACGVLGVGVADLAPSFGKKAIELAMVTKVQFFLAFSTASSKNCFTPNLMKKQLSKVQIGSFKLV